MTSFSSSTRSSAETPDFVRIDQHPSPLAKHISLQPVRSVAADGVNKIGILTLNVQHASAARSRRQVQWLGSRDDADVVVLTEVAGDTHAHTLVTELKLAGYEVVMPTDAAGQYRVLVASRIGVIEPGMFTAPMQQRLVSAQVAISQTRFDLIGVYVPSRGPANQRNVAKRFFQSTLSDLLLSHVDSFRSSRSIVVVAGDMNVVEPDHIPFHRVFGQWEYDFYRSFEKAGLTDAFRYLNPTLIEHSWYGRKRGSGYRFDHIFTNRPDALVSCKYIHESRTLGLSDHAAMVAALKLAPSKVSTTKSLGSDPTNPAPVKRIEIHAQPGNNCII